MSAGGPASPGGGGAASPRGERRRQPPAAGSPLQPILKEAGEIHSRLLDHRPVIQGEIRYFIKEFEEKRGLRELRVLENLKHTMSETKEHSLPKCEQAMRDNLKETVKRLQTVNNRIRKLQEKEHEEKKPFQGHSGTWAHLETSGSGRHWVILPMCDSPTAQKTEADRLMSGEEKRAAQWETFIKEQETKRAEVDEEHRKAMQRLKEQYASMDKELAKYVSF